MPKAFKIPLMVLLFVSYTPFSWSSGSIKVTRRFLLMGVGAIAVAKAARQLAPAVPTPNVHVMGANDGLVVQPSDFEFLNRMTEEGKVSAFEPNFDFRKFEIFTSPNLNTIVGAFDELPKVSEIGHQITREVGTQEFNHVLEQIQLGQIRSTNAVLALLDEKSEPCELLFAEPVQDRENLVLIEVNREHKNP